jgi:AcrR family transcriptional regulator
MAGLTEGALYRHYESREDLLADLFTTLVEPMITEKLNIVAMRAPIRDRLREWVRCTFASFDRDPLGFAYVLLTPLPLSPAHAKLAGRQSALFLELFEQGRKEHQLRDLDPALASALFVGLLLAVPQRIRSKRLKGPASQYIDEVSRTIQCALCLPDSSA